MKDNQEIYIVHEIVDGSFNTVIDSVWESEERAKEYILNNYKNLKVTKEPFILNQENVRETYYERLIRANPQEKVELGNKVNYSISNISLLEGFIRRLEKEIKVLKNKLKENHERSK